LTHLLTLRSLLFSLRGCGLRALHRGLTLRVALRLLLLLSQSDALALRALSLRGPVVRGPRHRGLRRRLRPRLLSRRALLLSLLTA